MWGKTQITTINKCFNNNPVLSTVLSFDYRLIMFCTLPAFQRPSASGGKKETVN